MLHFSETHEWVEEKEGVARIGISKQAEKELGDVVYIELPEEGSFVKCGEPVVVIESTKAAIDISSPLSGKILSVNSALRQNPSLINHSPEGEGWLFTLEPSNPEEVKGLLSAAEYNRSSR